MIIFYVTLIARQEQKALYTENISTIYLIEYK